MVSPRREDYTNEALEAIERAHAWASDMRNAQLDAEHLALGMLSIKDGMATKIFDFPLTIARVISVCPTPCNRKHGFRAINPKDICPRPFDM